MWSRACVPVDGASVVNILLLENERNAHAPVRRGLGELGHDVRVAANAEDACMALKRRAFDLAILDHEPPSLDGLALVRRLRADGHIVPIFLLTGTDFEAEDRAACLDAGADECLTRPFAFVELAARLNALARRARVAAPNATLGAQDIDMDLLRREVRRSGRPIRLRPGEFRLLEQLLRHADRIVTKAMLLERVWAYDFDPRTNVIETQISRLRAKLNEGFDRDAIQTVRGSGYMIRSLSK